MLIDLNKILGFEWNHGNLEKNQIKHNVTQRECEEAFFNNPLFLLDEKHFQSEIRYATYVQRIKIDIYS